MMVKIDMDWSNFVFLPTKNFEFNKMYFYDELWKNQLIGEKKEK